MRLRNRNHAIPGGFQWLQAETGFQAPANLSFNSVVDVVVRHRLGNPYITKKHNLATDWESVAGEVDSYNSLRMQGNSKWHNFIIDDAGGGASISSPFPWLKPSQLVGAVVGQPVKRVAAGVGVLLDWLGSSGKSVPREQAEKRAGVCTVCPQNRDGDWTSIFTKPVSEMLRLQLGIKNDLKLTTSKDDQLYVCQACTCPLKLKVHTPIKHIMDNMDEATKARLQPKEPVCWILEESQKQ